MQPLGSGTVGYTGSLTRELLSAVAIAQRDVWKFLRDRVRIISTFIFPVAFVLILGQSFDTGGGFGYDYRTFVFVGVLGQTMFQSAALGIVSLIEDRENDFSQAIFVAPISRYTIVSGKIAGEAIVALVQGLFIIGFGLAIGVPITLQQAIALLPASILVCLFGGAFGLLLMANIGSQRAANQLFPFVFLPQFFLAGVFNPISKLGPLLSILSALTPMRYAVDILRGIYYWGSPDAELVVLQPPLVNLAVLVVAGVAFMVAGTYMFVRSERNK
ncbi:MAG: ABC transporter permease [Anaerolineae bacterium]